MRVCPYGDGSRSSGSNLGSQDSPLAGRLTSLSMTEKRARKVNVPSTLPEPSANFSCGKIVGVQIRIGIAMFNGSQ